MNERLLTERQLAEMTGLAVQTLRNYRTSKALFPYVKLNRSVRYRLADIEAVLRGRRIDAEA